MIFNLGLACIVASVAAVPTINTKSSNGEVPITPVHVNYIPSGFPEGGLYCPTEIEGGKGVHYKPWETAEIEAVVHPDSDPCETGLFILCYGSLRWSKHESKAQPEMRVTYAKRRSSSTEQWTVQFVYLKAFFAGNIQVLCNTFDQTPHLFRTIKREAIDQTESLPLKQVASHTLAKRILTITPGADLRNPDNQWGPAGFPAELYCPFKLTNDVASKYYLWTSYYAVHTIRPSSDHHWLSLYHGEALYKPTDKYKIGLVIQVQYTVSNAEDGTTVSYIGTDTVFDLIGGGTQHKACLPREQLPKGEPQFQKGMLNKREALKHTESREGDIPIQPFQLSYIPVGFPTGGLYCPAHVQNGKGAHYLMYDVGQMQGMINPDYDACVSGLLRLCSGTYHWLKGEGDATPVLRLRYGKDRKLPSDEWRVYFADLKATFPGNIEIPCVTDIPK